MCGLMDDGVEGILVYFFIYVYSVWVIYLDWMDWVYFLYMLMIIKCIYYLILCQMQMGGL